ncbi:IS1 family transposase [Xenorhabdus sp. XENO-1]|uniref:IS1 family transposase n=1 Tax=Xenorhabdus bovienii TaxID=40576 RepID=UPI0020CA44D9|nr:IS1 family transposase [Xenorhabdus bovienii]MCP9267498.1 IS1 family transposase [Xenorhabdus bovienii subsp. africana]
MDEQWSFVGNKKQQRWLWYACEPRLKPIIVMSLGSEIRKCSKTTEKAIKIQSHVLVSDNFKAYNLLLSNNHLTEKIFTQCTERENLTFRIQIKRLNRKTLGYRATA